MPGLVDAVRECFATTLAAAPLGPLLRLLRTHRVEPACWPRAGVALAAGGLQALAAPFAPRPASAPPPVFVLGHWRSGTTLLHELLAAHPDLAAPTWTDVCNPSGHPWTAALLRRLLALALPSARHDDVPMRPDSPAECDFALAGLGLSPYLGWSFPQAGGRYDQYLSLRRLSAEDAAAWRQAYVGLVTRWSQGRRLALKSPPHTARLAALAKWFPAARFVFVHREPAATLASTLRMEAAGLGPLRLQRPAGDPAPAALARYRELHAEYFRARPRVRGRLCELSYAELVRDPLAAAQGLAGAWGLRPFDPAVPALRAALARHAARPRARHLALDPTLAARLRAECPECCEAFGAARAAA